MSGAGPARLCVPFLRQKAESSCGEGGGSRLPGGTGSGAFCLSTEEGMVERRGSWEADPNLLFRGDSASTWETHAFQTS